MNSNSGWLRNYNGNSHRIRSGNDRRIHLHYTGLIYVKNYK